MILFRHLKLKLLSATLDLFKGIIKVFLNLFYKLTNFIDMMDLSLCDNLSSRAMTTQLAIIVRIMIHSKGGQLTSHVMSLRTGLVGVNRNREVGPLSSGSS